MASHFRLGKYILFNNQLLSSTLTVNSPAVHILNLDNVFMQMNVTGTAVGAFSIQVSADHQQDQMGNVIVAGSWIEVVNIPITGTAINIGEDLNQLGAPWVRLQYTNVSSTGHVSAFVSGKGLM